MSALGDLLDYIARNLVDDPEAVRVEEEPGEEDDAVVLRLSVAQEDMGKVIGRSGRTARAIRVVVRAAATKTGLYPSVEIVE